MSEPSADGGEARAYTVRLELDDRPGELLEALEPIADHGGNLLGIVHERGSLTPRGRVPVEVDVACQPGQFDRIVAALRDAGVTVTRAGEERYGESLVVLLIGDLVETDLSDTLTTVQAVDGVDVTGMTLEAPEGTAEQSSARLHLATLAGDVAAALGAVQSVAEEKDLQVVEPVTEVEG
ncbi:MAG: amino acid-binding protein [Halobacteriaceae archaeon]